MTDTDRNRPSRGAIHAAIRTVLDGAGSALHAATFDELQRFADNLTQAVAQDAADREIGHALLDRIAWAIDGEMGDTDRINLGRAARAAVEATGARIVPPEGQENTTDAAAITSHLGPVQVRSGDAGDEQPVGTEPNGWNEPSSWPFPGYGPGSYQMYSTGDGYGAAVITECGRLLVQQDDGSGGPSRSWMDLTRTYASAQWPLERVHLLPETVSDGE